MSLRGRLTATICVICFVAIEIYIGYTHTTSLTGKQDTGAKAGETLRIWYTDEALGKYIDSAAWEYYENTGIRVETSYVSGREYLETINDKSLGEEGIPDLYIISNDSLEKAYLSGLASVITNPGGFVSSENFEDVSLNAVTYNGKYIGYPFYFETSYLLYNRTYIKEIAKQIVYQEWGMTEPSEEDTDGEGEEGEEAAVNPVSTIGPPITEEELVHQVEIKTEALMPHTINDILNYANDYDAPANVETIFKWDVSDIFFNYFILGAYSNLGGESGDDTSNFDIYNESTIRCFKMYQKINQFFSIDATTVDYNNIIQEFIDGKIIFTVASAGAIARLEEAEAAGDFMYEYGLLRIPDISDELKTRNLSVTNCIAINGYSPNKNAANLLAQYLCEKKVNDLYPRTGRMPAIKGVSYANPVMQTILAEYRDSIAIPKMLETSNFWIELELCFTKAWEGEDVNNLLKALSEKMKMQLWGSEYTEEYIPTPVEEEQEVYDEGMD